ncbi:DUF397 domain-containing protein [Streptomyces sclerotialus]|uniref:DUF397 domain-containing protein n=1 Tax=Streptomyces sclerotialus TaxID=1957 RepID=UPI00099E0D90
MSTDLNWHKSSYSGDQGACVQVAVATTCVHVRDSKDISRPAITASADTWNRFTTLIRVRSKALAEGSWSTRS